eukprot:gene3476-3974_t
MAPALMDADAKVSQSSDRKLTYFNSKILDNISNLASSRETVEKDINTAFSIKAKFTTSSVGRGGHSVKATNSSPENHILEKESQVNLNRNSNESMNDQHSDIIAASSSINCETQNRSHGRNELESSASATCALQKETDGANEESFRNQQSKTEELSTSYAVLRNKSIKTSSKLQSLDHRARSLREKLRDFQANRLITHVKKQAQLMDYTLRISNDLRQKHNDTEITSKNNGLNSTDKQQFPTKSKRCLPSSSSSTSTAIRQPSRLVNILKTNENDSPMSTCFVKGQQNLLALTTPPNEGKFEHCVSLESKKQIFGTLATQIEELTSLNDPEATDPESDIDDDFESSIFSPFDNKQGQKSKRKRVDDIWLKDRVKIGSMCTWIQAQIADLSHKIKRYGDFYQHVKSSRKHLLLEEKKQPIVTPTTESHKHGDDEMFAKNDLDGDGVQNNIFAKLQGHRNGLARDLSGQSINEIKYEKISGARTLPMTQLPKHKYVKRKTNSVSVEQSQCPNLPSVFPCKQCQKSSGRSNANIPAVNLDHNYHEQLSAKYDVLLPHLLESTLKKDKIYSGRKNLLPASSTKESLVSEQKAVSNRKHSIAKLASTTADSAGAAKIRLERKRSKRVSKNGGDDSEFEESPQAKKRIATLSAASQLQKRANSLRAPSGSGSGESRPSTPVVESQFLSASYPSPTLLQLGKKKNRPSSEYDINNIEDTSDFAYARRHSNCEVTEHKRFTSYFQLPLRRSRSSRKSSECNTPEPYSPQHPDNSNSSFASTPSEFILATPLSAKMSRQNSFANLVLQQEEYKATGWTKRVFPLGGADENQLLNPHQALPQLITEPGITSLANNNNNTALAEHHNHDVEMQSIGHDEDSRDMDIQMRDISPSCDNEVDEKWTVKSSSTVEETGGVGGSGAKKGIVLKLAKK